MRHPLNCGAGFSLPTRRAFLLAAASLAACRRAGVLRLVTYQGAETPQIARSLGLFEEQGLRIDLQELAGAAKAMESLLGGSADVILGTYDQALQVNAQGKRVKSFMLISECHCLGLVSPAISEIATLRGRTVGVSSPGGPMQNFVAYLLKRAGLPADSVSYAAVGIGASSVTAVEHGKVDAAVVFYGSMLELKKRNPALHVLAETYTRDGARAVFHQATFPSTSLLARAEWLVQDPETARRLVRVFRATIDWMKSQPVEDVRAKLPPETRNPDAEIDLATLRVLIPMLSPTGRMTVDEAQLSLDILGVHLKTPIEDTFTNEYLS